MSNCGCNKNEDLRKWFGKGGAGGTTAGGWDRYGSDGQKLGKCGDAKAGEPYSACLSAEKARKLGKKGIANFVKRKRAAQKKSGDAKKGGEQKKGQKPTYVKTGASESVVEEFGAPIGYLPSPSRKSVNKMKKSGNTSGKYGNYKLAERFQLFLEKNVPTDPTKWSYYKSQAKKKFDVYPSAYANAWAAKKYKAAGGKWKTEEAKLEKEKFTKPDQMRVNELVFTNTTRLDGYEVAKFVKAYKKLNTKNLVRFDKSKGMYYGYPRGSKQPHWKYDKDSGKIYHSLDNQLVLGLLNAYNMVSKNHPWALSESINEGIRYNMEMGIPLENPPYRYGSRKFFNYINELRQVNQDVISDEIKEILNSDIGKIGIYEGKKVPLDFPMLAEAEYQGKDVELNKPKRGGSKKFYVYVKDGDKVKKVSFGAKSGGQSLAVKLQDPKARKAFADRHDCKNKTDKTKAGYWACRIGRYWKSLGGGKNFSGYW